MATCPECHASHVFLLMIRVIMRWNRELCIDLLEFILWLRKIPNISAGRPSNEGYATSQRLRWNPLPQKESVGSHSTSGREKEGKKKRKGGPFAQNQISHCNVHICFNIPMTVHEIFNNISVTLMQIAGLSSDMWMWSQSIVLYVLLIIFIAWNE